MKKVRSLESCNILPRNWNTIVDRKGQRGAVGCKSNVEVVGLNPIKGPLCFLEQEILLLLLSTGWFQERIGA